MPSIYLIFTSKSHLGLYHEVFYTLEEAWNGAKFATEEYRQSGGRNLRMLHATFQEFLHSSRPDGTDGQNRLIPDWIWGDYASADSETRRVMGEATIKEILLSVPGLCARCDMPLKPEDLTKKCKHLADCCMSAL